MCAKLCYGQTYMSEKYDKIYFNQIGNWYCILIKFSWFSSNLTKISSVQWAPYLIFNCLLNIYTVSLLSNYIQDVTEEIKRLPYLSFLGPTIYIVIQYIARNVHMIYALFWFVNPGLEGYFTGTGAIIWLPHGAIIWLPQCQWSNPKGYR